MASLVERQQDVGQYRVYRVTVANVIGILWVLPHLAERAWMDSVDELNSFAAQAGLVAH